MNHDKSIISFFTKKEKQDLRTTASGDYAVVRNRRVDMVIRILSVVCAIAIWTFNVIGDSASKDFTNFNVSAKGIALVQKSYTVEYDITQVNFKIQGKGSQISQISDSDVQVYVDISTLNLSNINGSQTFDLPLIYDVKNKTLNVVFTDKSRETIKVIITKK